MDNKKFWIITMLIFVIIFSGCNSGSTSRQLSGVWELFDIDESGLPGSASSPVTAAVSALYLASLDRPERIRAMGSGNILLGAQIRREMDTASEALETVRLIIERKEMKIEIDGQRTIFSYSIRDGAIRIEHSGTIAESDFRTEDDFLFFGGFAWVRDNYTLNGRWGNDENRITMVNGTVTVTSGNKSFLRGNYSTIGNRLTTTITEIHGGILNNFELESRWYTRDELSVLNISESLDLDKIFFSEKGTFTVEKSVIFGDNLYEIIRGVWTGL